MKKLTVLAAAFAAGLTSFAANSEPHPSHSLRGEGAESAPAAKAQAKSAAKDVKQQQKTTARTETRQAETRQPKRANTKAEIMKTPLFIVRDAAGENKPAVEKQPKGRRVAEKSTQKKRVVEKAEPKKNRVAKTAEPKRTRVASKSESKAKQAAEKKTPKTKQVAEKSTPKLEEVVAVRPTPKPEQVEEKSTPKAKKVAERKTPKAEKVAEKSTAKPQDGGDRLVAVKESGLDLVQTASLGSKGAKTMKGAGGRFAEIIAKYAASYGVPVSLAHAVIQVESNYRPDAKGRAGEIGLMQIKPSTARMMGYEGSTQGLFHPETNIKYGMKYLAKAQKVGDGTTCGTILKYNAGHAAKRMNPVSSAYCVKVKRFLGV
jgi:soluble lytic murein transglycosylase-like protein